MVHCCKPYLLSPFTGTTRLVASDNDYGAVICQVLSYEIWLIQWYEKSITWSITQQILTCPYACQWLLLAPPTTAAAALVTNLGIFTKVLLTMFTPSWGMCKFDMSRKWKQACIQQGMLIKQRVNTCTLIIFRNFAKKFYGSAEPGLVNNTNTIIK